MRWAHLSAPPDSDNPDQAAPTAPLLPLALPGATVRTFDTPGFMGMTFYEIQAKSIINRVPGSSRVPFEWTINPYRGCSHACSYCLAGETPILMADGSARPLAQRHIDSHGRNLRIGDRLRGTGTFAHPPKDTPDYRSGYLYGLVRGDAALIRHRSRPGRPARTADAVAPRPQKPLPAPVRLPRSGRGPCAEPGPETIGGSGRSGRQLGPESWFRFATRGSRTATGPYAGSLTTAGPVAVGSPHLAGGRRRGGAALLAVGPHPADTDQPATTPYLVDAPGIAAESRHAAGRPAACDPAAPPTAQATLDRTGLGRPGGDPDEPWVRADAYLRDVTLPRALRWPEVVTDGWLRGFVAGLFGAAGRFEGLSARIVSQSEELLASALDALARLGLDARWVVEQPFGAMPAIEVAGSLREVLALVHGTGITGVPVPEATGHPVAGGDGLTITSIEPLGLSMQLYDITTGTGDFIADGVVSHNCFARNTHTYLDLDAGHDFDSKVIVKVNAGELVRRELAAPRWRGAHIAMGTNVDVYQRAEGRYRLMPPILTALRDFANPFSILTKGTLILRDLPLLRQAADVTQAGLIPRYRELFRDGSYLPQTYQREIIGRVRRAARRHGLHRADVGESRQPAGATAPAAPEQLSLL